MRTSENKSRNTPKIAGTWVFVFLSEFQSFLGSFNLSVTFPTWVFSLGSSDLIGFSAEKSTSFIGKRGHQKSGHSSFLLLFAVFPTGFFGSERWQKKTARRMGLEFRLRPRDCPRTEAKSRMFSFLHFRAERCEYRNWNRPTNRDADRNWA
jgi:hypothetical protein